MHVLCDGSIPYVVGPALAAAKLERQLTVVRREAAGQLAFARNNTGHGDAQLVVRIKQRSKCITHIPGQGSITAQQSY